MRTIAEAITDLATKAKGSQAVPRGRKITDALDALADAMAGTDVPLARCTTIVNAIDTITANYGGGGGGVDVGAPTLVVKKNFAPEVGEYIPGTSAIGGVAIGEAVIVPVDSFNVISEVAAGVTATTAPDSELAPTACAAYVVTVDDEEKITTVAPWGGTLTPGTYDPGMGALNVWSFDVPALEYDDDTGVGQVLFLHLHK